MVLRLGGGTKREGLTAEWPPKIAMKLCVCVNVSTLPPRLAGGEKMKKKAKRAKDIGNRASPDPCFWLSHVTRPAERPCWQSRKKDNQHLQPTVFMCPVHDEKQRKTRKEGEATTKDMMET